jgi:hypothetical protein
MMLHEESLRCGTLRLHDLFRKPLVAQRDQPHASSDGGAIVLEAADRYRGPSPLAEIRATTFCGGGAPSRGVQIPSRIQQDGPHAAVPDVIYQSCDRVGEEDVGVRLERRVCGCGYEGFWLFRREVVRIDRKTTTVSAARGAGSVQAISMVLVAHVAVAGEIAGGDAIFVHGTAMLNQSAHKGRSSHPQQLACRREALCFDPN